MSDIKETTITLTFNSFSFGDLSSDDFDKVLSSFDWSLKDVKVEFDNSDTNVNKDDWIVLYFLYAEYLLANNCRLAMKYESGRVIEARPNARKTNAEYFEKLFDSKEKLLKLIEKSKLPILISNSSERKKALKFVEKFIGFLDLEYEKTLRYIINEILYNTLEHGRNGHDIPSFLEFIWDKESNELSFIIADVGVGIKKHLRQTPSAAGIIS